MFWLFIISVAVTSQASATDQSVRQLWQLVDYVGADYGGAVEGGKVKNQGEYAEMVEFANNSVRLVELLPSSPSKTEIASKVRRLQDAVLRKDERSDVIRLANDANLQLLAAYQISVAPHGTPDLARGATLYSSQCAACHGAKGGGDGPLSLRLSPRPIAFIDQERADSRSLMALYQVISHGVEGTSMPSFTSLSEKDRWALAFYVGTLSHNDTMRANGKALWNQDGTFKRRFPDLAALSTASVASTAQVTSPGTARDVIAYLRSSPGAISASQLSGIAFARARLKDSLVALHAGDTTKATALGLSAYLDGFEPLEPSLSSKNQPLVVAIESAMLAFRASVANGTTKQAEDAASRLDELFAQADDALGNSRAEPITTFLGALTILLREGVEALLIVIGIIAFLKRAGRYDVLRHVHAGWISALCVGGLTWAAATYVVTVSGASREVTEGVGSVLAAVVLLSVGMWMHQKSSADRWQSYIAEKLSVALTRRSAWGLFALAFIAVYREVFETVLFYSALAADGNSAALAAGFLAAVASLSGIGWFLLRSSARMPIGRFFSLTSFCVAALAIVLIGKGVSALQEAGWVAVHPIPMLRIALLGIYPTAETMMGQTLVLAIALAAFAINTFTAQRAADRMS